MIRKMRKKNLKICVMFGTPQCQTHVELDVQAIHEGLPKLEGPCLVEFTDYGFGGAKCSHPIIEQLVSCLFRHVFFQYRYDSCEAGKTASKSQYHFVIVDCTKWPDKING